MNDISCINLMIRLKASTIAKPTLPNCKALEGWVRNSSYARNNIVL